MTFNRPLHTRTMGLILAALLALASQAQAGDPRTEARARYEKGSVLYDLQRYEEAAVEYEAAYELKPDPAILFNLGQAYRLAKKPERAIRAYSSYLRRMSQAKNRTEVEARIAEMRTLEAQQRAEAEAAAAPKVEPTPVAPTPASIPTPELAPPPATAPAPLSPRVRTLKWAGLGLGLGGIALGAVGGGLYGVGQAAFKELDQPAPGTAFDPATERRMNTLRPTGVALLVVGIVAAGAGFTLFGVSLKKERASHQGAGALLPGSTGSMMVLR